MFRRIRKTIGNRLIKPLALRYIRREREIEFDGIRIRTTPGVFHPGMYFSTKFMLKYLRKQELKGKTFMELGAGSGLVSIWAALHQAVVTATEINRIALEDIQYNAQQNRAHLTVLYSDMWDSMSRQKFDWLVVNPPYYPRYPATAADRAWYCGENFEYFHRFFAGLGEFTHAKSRIAMVLSEDCELEKIKSIAAEYNYSMKMVQKGIKWGEWNYIFGIERDLNP